MRSRLLSARPCQLVAAALISSLPLRAGAEVRTVVHPEEEFSPRATVVWTPIFQATWDHLNRHYGGKPFRIEPKNQLLETP